jgi:hypothetical protein
LSTGPPPPETESELKKATRHNGFWNE